MNHRMILFSTILLFLSSNCNSQKKAIITDKDKAVKELYNETIWIPMQNEESYKLKIADTTVKELNLIFEQEFDDSIKIFLDSKELFSKTIKTIGNLSVVNDEFNIKYDNRADPLIEILLVGKNKTISFKPKQGYVICYLDRINEIWSLDFSNYQRSYY